MLHSRVRHGHKAFTSFKYQLFAGRMMEHIAQDSYHNQMVLDLCCAGVTVQHRTRITNKPLTAFSRLTEQLVGSLVTQDETQDV